MSTSFTNKMSSNCLPNPHEDEKAAKIMNKIIVELPKLCRFYSENNRGVKKAGVIIYFMGCGDCCKYPCKCAKRTSVDQTYLYFVKEKSSGNFGPPKGTQTPDDASLNITAAREVNEELGIIFEALEENGTVKISFGKTSNYEKSARVLDSVERVYSRPKMRMFAVRVAEKFPKDKAQIDNSEIAESGWFSIGELKEFACKHEPKDNCGGICRKIQQSNTIISILNFFKYFEQEVDDPIGES